MGAKKKNPLDSFEVALYQKPHRRVGGNSGSWKVDPVMVDHMVGCFMRGADERTACQTVGLPFGVYRKWMSLGERLLEQTFMDDVLVLTDEETSYLEMYKRIAHAVGMWKMKNAIVIDAGIEGNVDIARSKLALSIMARKNPAEWDYKSGNVARDVEDSSRELALGSEPRHTKLELLKLKKDKGLERDAEVARRRGGGEEGD